MAPRILFVTGKGGTGKSRVAEALARVATAKGRPAVLVRTSPPRETGVRRTPWREIVLDDDRALGDFLIRALRFSFLARRLQDSRTFSAVAAAAPGLRDLVRLTSITGLVATSSPRTVIVVDAPASGHSVPLLTAPATVLGFARIGPVEHDAREASRIVADPRIFLPVLVTIPEEFAITETMSLVARLDEAGVAPARVVVNGLWPAYLDADSGDALAASGVSEDARQHWQRHRRQAELVAGLEEDVGRCEKIAFRFHAADDDALAGDDVDALFVDLVENAA